MDEIGVHHRKIAAVRHRIEQLLAHPHQRRGAAGRKIEPAQQFLPARLGRLMHFGCGRVVRIGLPGRDRAFPCAHGRARIAEPAPRRRRCADRWSARNSGSGFRAPAPPPRLRRGPDSRSSHSTTKSAERVTASVCARVDREAFARDLKLSAASRQKKRRSSQRPDSNVGCGDFPQATDPITELRTIPGRFYEVVVPSPISYRLSIGIIKNNRWAPSNSGWKRRIGAAFAAASSLLEVEDLHVQFPDLARRSCARSRA